MSLALALQSGDVSSLPSRRDEAWRYTDLRAALRAIPAASPKGETPVAAGPFAAIAGVEAITIVNGFGPDSLTLAAGEHRTVCLRVIASEDASAHHAALTIEVGEGAQLTLLESHEGFGSAYVSDMAISLNIGSGAAVERVVILSDSSEAISVVTATVDLAANASLNQTVLTNGAKRQRFETHVTHPGQGASVRLDGVYLLGDARHSDQTTVVAHQGEGGTTNQLTKGAVRDNARAVFQGKITVARGADQTDARMGHHALILSERAEIDAKPELEIYADDVSCAHGNTVGALDDEALFYIRSRGVPLEEARALLISAFVGEVTDRIVHEGARSVAQDWLLASGMGAS
jgi:Fe-S cluster assembly protein SufD